jgi:hypothetical protein
MVAGSDDSGAVTRDLLVAPRECIRKLERTRMTYNEDRFATVQSLAAFTIRNGTDHKPCGHRSHVGWCSECQRVQLARWRAQLAEVDRFRLGAYATG